MTGNLLGFWPTPLEDEPLFSILARLKAMLGVASSDRIVSAAFGEPRLVRLDTHLPGRLDYLASRTPKAFDGGGSTILLGHTSFPYGSRFMDRKQFDRVRGLLLGYERTRKIPRGFLRGPGRSRKLAFCPACVEDDLGRWPNAGWRRVHQMPAVAVCPWHRIALLESRFPAVALLDLPDHLDGASDGRPVECPLNVDDALFLAKASLWLLSNPSESGNTADLSRVMKDALESRNMLGKGPNWDRDLLAALRQRFGQQGLTTLRWTTGDGRIRPLNSALARTGHQTFVPVRYLALMAMAGVHPKQFFQSLDECQGL